MDLSILQIHSEIISSLNPNPELLVTKSKHKGTRKLSQHEKFRKAILLTSELASVVSMASSIHFRRRMKLLQDLTNHWKCGEEVGLKEIDDGNQVIRNINGLINTFHPHLFLSYSLLF